MKIIKTKINNETTVYVLIFNEVTNAKSLIMAHGGEYLNDKLIISDNVDSREYSLKCEIEAFNIDGNRNKYRIKADKCRFVEFPLIEELLKIRCGEVTEFVSCLEILKDINGNYLEISR